MNQIEKPCFICGAVEFDNQTKEYRCCKLCGHETLIETERQGLIINDDLLETTITKVTGLDRFKTKVLSDFDKNLDRQLLLDIGSASGKFLYQNKIRYLKAMGLEITPESIEFSRGVLDLDIVENSVDIPSGINTATAWHSLEHIPTKQLLDLLNTLSENMTEGGRLIVSVPNGASRQYMWFGSAFAYFDVPNHLHQFTPDSLEQLMQHFNFQLVKTVSSWPYNTFGYTQSLLNVITKTHNYLYFRLKRRSRRPSLRLDIINGLLMPFVVPFGWMFGVLDSVFQSKQGVITSCFEKRTC